MKRGFCRFMALLLCLSLCAVPALADDMVDYEADDIVWASTPIYDESQGQITNLHLASASIDGWVVGYGETFSFNGVVGKRTKEAGYRPAPAYAAMQTVMEYGGGICQVSSTLYAAVRKAGLEVVERYPHSLSVSYIPKGMDATVDWGNKDFKFKNNRSEPIYIACYVDGFEQVHVSLYGSL